MEQQKTKTVQDPETGHFYETIDKPQTTTTLAGTELNLDALYFVDWQSMKGVEDLVLIFASMGLSFSGRHPHFDTIKHLLDLSNPVVPNQPLPQQPEKRDFKLPEIKKIK